MTYLAVENKTNGDESENACTAVVQARRVVVIESCIVCFVC